MHKIMHKNMQTHKNFENFYINIGLQSPEGCAIMFHYTVKPS